VEVERHSGIDEGVKAGNDNGKKEDGKDQSEEGEGGHGEDQQSCQTYTNGIDIKGR
jgi:hypothetical protein